jgi:DNA polymerase-3 subunit gamma/tau
VIELDAASHNKVEDVREIRANVGTVASAGGARRVYILDEAHMLSRAASNALLKTLEEPPEHAIFVLATTEPYKLPDTIRSRTQRFDFHPIGSEALIEHLDKVSLAEGFTVTHESLALIARHAVGSARDALGLLEQVAALGGGTVETRGVTRALGLADVDAFGKLVAAIDSQSAAAGLMLVSSLAAEGSDLRRFVSDSIEFFRGIFLAQYAPNLEEIVDESAEVLEEWRGFGRTLAPADVLRCIDRLGAALVELRDGREERLVVELAVLQLTRPETSPDPAALASRLDRLEERVRILHERSAAGPLQQSTPVPTPAPEMTVRPRTEPEKTAEAPRTLSVVPDTPDVAQQPVEPVEEVRRPPAAAAMDAASPTMEQVDTAWPAIMARVRDEAGMRRHALFREAKPADVEGNRLILEIPAHLPFHLAQLSEDDHLNAVIVAAASEALGGRIALVYRSADGHGSVLTQPDDEHDDTARAPDKNDMDDVGHAEIDPTGLVIDLLGGEVVED